MQADRGDRDEMWQMTESSGSCVVVVVVVVDRDEMKQRVVVLSSGSCSGRVDRADRGGMWQSGQG